MKSKRIQWLDFAKGFTIFFVVLEHVLQASNNISLIIEYWSFTFSMPIFFAISGYLYRPIHNTHGFKLLLYKKISGFSIPYILFSIISIILFYMRMKGHLILYKYLFVPSSYMWFLYALFFIFIIKGLVDLIHVKFFIQIIIAVCLLIGQWYLPWQQGFININPIAGIFGYFICFYIGNLLYKYHFANFVKKISCKKLMIAPIIWMFLMCIQYSLAPTCDTDLFSFPDTFTKLLSIPIFFILFIKMPSNTKLFKYLNKYGKYTLIIYLVHYPLLECIHRSVKYKLDLSNIFVFLVTLIIVWGISIFVCVLAKKYKSISFVFYPRKYLDKIFLTR